MAAAAKQHFDTFVTKGDEFIEATPAAKAVLDPIHTLAKQKVPRPVIAAAICFLVVVVFLVVGGGPLLVKLVGVAPPIYFSFQALQTEGTDDDSQWLTYWVVYNSLNVVEDFAAFIIVWIPYYYFFKVAFLVACYHPRVQFSQTVYKKYIKPLFKKATENASSVLGGAKHD
jgi:receptor expression-enhancing protein 5/6